MKKIICALAVIAVLFLPVCSAFAAGTDDRFIPPEEAIGMTEAEMMNRAVELLTDAWRYGGKSVLSINTYNGPNSRHLSEEGYLRILHVQICYLDEDYTSRETVLIKDNGQRNAVYGVYCVIEFTLLSDAQGTAPYYTGNIGTLDEVVVMRDGSMAVQSDIFTVQYIQRYRMEEIPKMMAKVVQTDEYNAVYYLRDKNDGGPEKPAEAETMTEKELRMSYPLTDEYKELILGCAREYNLYPGMIAAVIRAETSFRPDAESSGGARGLMQLTPETAAWIADQLQDKDYSFDLMFDPESNIRYGSWYLRYLRKVFSGDPVCIIAAYHAGQGTVQSWLANPEISGDGITIPTEKIPDGATRQYVQQVLKGYWYYEELYDWQ